MQKSETQFSIEVISPEEAMEFWGSHLWPDARKNVRPLSSMVFGGGYDLEIYQRSVPIFWGARHSSGELMGVVSGFSTSDTHFRSRGLCVHPSQRGQGLGVALLKIVSSHAAHHGFQLIWSFPRNTAFNTYQRAGFRQVSPWLANSEGQGQNCYAIIDL